MEKILNEVKAYLKALLCFAIACLLLPFLLLSFIYEVANMRLQLNRNSLMTFRVVDAVNAILVIGNCVHYCNELVNYILSIKYPTLIISKSKKIRSLIDTPRNAGIFHFLVQIKGTCDFEKIKRFYAEHITDVRDKGGLLRFPKLRQKLVTCWGHYAWVIDNSAFSINNHVLLGPSTYRGRPVNDGNIQEFISDLVTKYIPSDLPQWQVIVIPISKRTSFAEPDINNVEDALADDHYYLLIKIHHLIIAEEEDLHISEMVMLQERERRQTIDIEAFTQVPQKSQSHSYFVRKPVHIQNLWRQIKKLIVNRWNAFIYEFESLETPDGYRSVQINNIRQLLSVLIIITVNVIMDYWIMMKARQKLRRCTRAYRETTGRWRTFMSLLLREVEKRNLSWQIAYSAIIASLQPKTLAKNLTRFLWQININHFVLLPYHVYCEALALRDLILKGQTNLKATYLGSLSVYLPLLIYAQMEFFKICYELFKAPVNIYEEIFEQTSKESNILQLKSYSGRKIVSFSKTIDAKALRKRLNFNTEVRESDFTLSCLAGAIQDYFESYAHICPMPKLLNTTCRTMAKGYLTEHTGDKTDYIGGVVFLKLPLRIPDREHGRQIHGIVEQIRRKQIMIYLASMGQTKYDFLTSLVPRVLTKICINYCAFQFPVTITEIHGATSDFQTVWGQQVEDVLLFRPPQSKTCLSLNIHRFGDKYRLAIMADTQLGPDHAIITRAFEKYMETAEL